MDKEFPQGIFVKRPHENAPEFVKAKITINKGDAMRWLSGKGDYVNLDLKVSREGKLYLQVDNWQPKKDYHAPDPTSQGFQNEPEIGGHVEQPPF